MLPIIMLPIIIMLLIIMLLTIMLPVIMLPGSKRSVASWGWPLLGRKAMLGNETMKLIAVSLELKAWS